eukprot:1371031-Amorphochlora_amoeboformis.AAC.1
MAHRNPLPRPSPFPRAPAPLKASDLSPLLQSSPDANGLSPRNPRLKTEMYQSWNPPRKQRLPPSPPPSPPPAYLISPATRGKRMGRLGLELGMGEEKGMLEKHGEPMLLVKSPKGGSEAARCWGLVLGLRLRLENARLRARLDFLEEQEMLKDDRLKSFERQISEIGTQQSNLRNQARAHLRIVGELEAKITECAAQAGKQTLPEPATANGHGAAVLFIVLRISDTSFTGKLSMTVQIPGF